jgi:hypothetical protein
VAAGAVYIGAIEFVLESDPRAGALHVTPALALSLTTFAVSITVSLPSTIVEEAATETLTAFEPPVFPPVEALPPLPQPERQRGAIMLITQRLMAAQILKPKVREFDLIIWRPFTS